MSAQLLIRIDDKLKNKVSLLAKKEGKTASDVVRYLLDKYVQDHDMDSHIETLWKSIGKELNKQHTQADIKSVINAVRKQKRHESRY